MGKIMVTTISGERVEVEGKQGESLMRLMLDSGITGIAAECGGCLSCATCHVYVSPDWAERLPPASSDEMVMVDCAIDVRDTSRLSCQIKYSDELDGIEIEIPTSQY